MTKSGTSGALKAPVSYAISAAHHTCMLTSTSPIRMRSSKDKGDRMKISTYCLVVFGVLIVRVGVAADEPEKKNAESAASQLSVGDKAPAFKVKDSAGKTIDLAELTQKGP